MRNGREGDRGVRANGGKSAARRGAPLFAAAPTARSRAKQGARHVPATETPLVSSQKADTESPTGTQLVAIPARSRLPTEPSRGAHSLRRDARCLVASKEWYPSSPTTRRARRDRYGREPYGAVVASSRDTLSSMTSSPTIAPSTPNERTRRHRHTTTG